MNLETNKATNLTSASTPVAPLERQNATPTAIVPVRASEKNPLSALRGKIRSLWNKSSSDSTTARDSVSTQSSHSITPSKRESENSRGSVNARRSESTAGSENVRESSSKASVPSNKGFMQRMGQAFRRSSLPKNDLEPTAKAREELDQAEINLEKAISTRNLLYNPRVGQNNLGPPPQDLVALYDEQVKKAQSKRDEAFSNWQGSLLTKSDEADSQLQKAYSELESAIREKNDYVRFIEDPKTTPLEKSLKETRLAELDEKIAVATRKYDDVRKDWGTVKEEAALPNSYRELETFKIDLKATSPDINVLIKTPIGYEEMRAIGKSAYMEENIIFLKHIDEYKTLVKEYSFASTENKEIIWKKIQEKYNDIITNYIANGSQYEVNLNSGSLQSEIVDTPLTKENMITKLDSAFDAITKVTNLAIKDTSAASAQKQMQELKKKYFPETT